TTTRTTIALHGISIPAHTLQNIRRNIHRKIHHPTKNRRMTIHPSTRTTAAITIMTTTAMPETSAAPATTPAHRTMVLTTAQDRRHTTLEVEVVGPPALTRLPDQDLPPPDRVRLLQAPTRAQARHPAAPAHPLDQATARRPVLQRLRRPHPRPRTQTAD